MALRGDMSGSENLPDTTDSPEFIREHADRVLAWEMIHGFWCAGKVLRPCRIAERLGVPSKVVQDDIKTAIEKAKAFR